MLIKATMTVAHYNIVAGAIYSTEKTEDEKRAMVSGGLAVEIKTDEKHFGKIDKYTPKPYPNFAWATNFGKLWYANVGDGNFTSPTWVESEWVNEVPGV